MDETTTETPHTCDAAVVGAGFAELYMLHRLRGLGLRVRVFEAGGGVGGVAEMAVLRDERPFESARLARVPVERPEVSPTSSHHCPLAPN